MKSNKYLIFKTTHKPKKIKNTEPLRELKIIKTKLVHRPIDENFN